MRKLIFRLFFIVIAAVFLAMYVVPWSNYGISIPFSWKDYRLWLDLQGGIELDYKIDLEEVRKAPDYDKEKEKSIIEGLKSIIDKRVQVLNINDSQITGANYGGEQHIIVQIPLKGNDSLQNNENIERAKEAIGRVVKIEFKERRTSITDEDKKERFSLSEKALVELKASTYPFSVTWNKYRDSYENVDVWTLTWTIESLSSYFVLSSEKIKKWVYDEVLSGTWKSSLSFEDGTITQKFDGSGYWVLDIVDIKEDTKEITMNYVFVTDTPSEWIAAMDKKGRILNDKYFVKSSVQYNEAFQPMIELTFNTEWAEIFWELTKRLTGQQIAIFVGWQMLTAPNVNEAILSGKAVITGTYSPEEAKNLSQDINTWVVPAPIYLTSERTIDSRLGLNSLQALVVAGGFWFLIIMLFLVFTYRASGLIASFTLLLYILIILAIVKALWIVLTLASIAWLILSVWMAIDANILIFERIKDELQSGQKMNDALKVWFEKSFSAIWDSNITGLIVALILFIFGINMIKWFGLMLALWIVVSLVVFYYISRVFIFLLWKSSLSHTQFIGIKK